MRVSAKADYALRALIEMAARGDGDDGRRSAPRSSASCRRSRTASSRRSWPTCAGRIVHRPARPVRRLADGRARPTDVTVADVIRAVDGPLVSVYGLRPEAVSYNERAEVLQHVWIAARHSLRDVFEQVSIADLAAGSCPTRSPRSPPTRTPGSRTEPRRLDAARSRSLGSSSLRSAAHPARRTAAACASRRAPASSSSGVWMIGSKP